MNKNNNKTAAILIIGSEIINGEVTDTNGKYVSRELSKIGFRISSINIVNDDLDYAARFIAYLSELETIVVTIGGLGPTIDDITMAAVAQAFDLPIISRRVKSALDFRKMSGSETQNNLLRKMPKGSQIINSDNGPIVKTRNVFSLPGLPSLVKNRLKILVDHLPKPSEKKYKKEWAVRSPQSAIAGLLGEIGTVYPQVEIGCYPQGSNSKKTKIVLSGKNQEEIEKVFGYLSSPDFIALFSKHTHE